MVARFLLFLALASGVLGRSVTGMDPSETLAVSPDSVSGLGGNVTVTWTNIGFGMPTDWIGMWTASANLTLFSAPIKFKYLTPNPLLCPKFRTQAKCLSLKGACQWSPDRAHANKCVPSPPPANGSVSFFVQNMRQDVVFFYITGDIQYPAIKAKSPVVRLLNPNMPQGVHLALESGGDPSKMGVYWQAGGTVSSPGVLYTDNPNGIKLRGNHFDPRYIDKHSTCDGCLFAKGWANPGRQYSPSDMCDTNVQPAGRQGWMDPGNLLQATMVNLNPGTTYYYIYGDNATGWSEQRSFVAAPRQSPNMKMTIAAFGDMGQTEADGSFHHSWDFGDHGELPSQNTTDRLFQDEDSELILHIGDISYAVGYLSEWNNFFWQIEPVASRRPWMTSIGNHEQVYSQSFYPGTDSGGECGVPYNAHFPFASQDPYAHQPFSNRQPWYSFRYGSATFIQMSTEHDYRPGSQQYAWIEKALADVDRSVTPWIIFSGHRPMYIGSDWPGDHEVADALQKALEPLLARYKVDVAIWGHNHSYQRFCRMTKGKCTAGATQHLVIGMAGYDHSLCPQQKANWPSYLQLCNDTKWGYVRMHFNSANSLVIVYVDGATGATLDTVAVDREDHSPSMQFLLRQRQSSSNAHSQSIELVAAEDEVVPEGAVSTSAIRIE